MITNKSDNIASGDQLNKKTVVKNTIMLYVRMFVLMIVGFITTRVVLRSLGEIDYGLNNAVAGFVALFAVLTGSLNAAISRFITFELGRDNQEKLNKVFSSAVFIQLVMAIVIAILVETVGMWFMTNHMTIPIERMSASRWVLHFAVINTFITLTFVPYSAAIISHEKMGIYAYVSIIEGLLHLLIAYLIALDFWGDKLIFYSGAICLTSLFVNAIYRFYCRHYFEECHLRIVFDRSLLKSIGEFAGWNLIGAASGVLKTQGINILFNMFFGPAVNAAQGISNQTSGLATRFSNGFTTALNPQITKSYASGNFNYMYSLVFQGTRMSYFLYLLLALPIFLETEGLLSLWLVNFPEHTAIFVKVVLITIMLDNIIANPLVTIMLATGNIKTYQLIVGGIQTLAFPLAYIMLKLGSSPELVLIMVALVAMGCMVSRIMMLNKMISFPVRDYLLNVIFVLIKVTVIASLLPILFHYILPRGIWWSVLVSGIAVLSASLTMWLFGFTKSEKFSITEKIVARAPFMKILLK